MEIIQADLENNQHAEAVLKILNAYAQDLTGYEKPLPEDVRETLIPALRNHPTTIVFLAENEGVFCGVCIAFTGFSTFAAKPLLNIHDIAVLKELRGRGIGKALLEAALDFSRRNGYCKVTLEAYENNPAVRLYRRCGFETSELDESAGSSMYFVKKIDE